MRCAGFSGGRGGKLTRSDAAGTRCGAVIDDALQHVSDHVSNPWIEHLGLLRLEVVNYIAISITHGTDHDGSNALAVIGENRVSGSHVHGRGVIRSQGHGGRGADG